MSEPTPRPWHADGADNRGFSIWGPGPNDAVSWGGDISEPINRADADLIVEAVNAYDRLRDIEAAARVLYDRLERVAGGPMQDDIEELGVALERIGVEIGAREP
jgi:hypothetical protein